MSKFRELLLSLAGLGLLCLLQGQTHARPAFHYASAPREKISLRAGVASVSLTRTFAPTPILVIDSATGGTPSLRLTGFARLPLSAPSLPALRYRVFRTGLSPPRDAASSV